MNREDYIATYVNELGKHVDIGERNASQCAEAAFADDPDGDPEEAAQAEAHEWKAAS